MIGALSLLRVCAVAAMALDRLLIPAVRRQRVTAPIVVVGDPRSGTTFLHRFLVDHGFGVGTRLAGLLFPAVVQRTMLRPLLPYLERWSPARHHAAAVHDTSLISVETDDPALLLRYFDGPFSYAFFLAWAGGEWGPSFLPGGRDTTERDFAHLDQVWRRTLVAEGGQRMVAKLFSLTARLPAFLDRFPDAKVVYLIRDPLASVPSGLSLVTGVLDGWFGYWRLAPEVRQRFVDRLYTLQLESGLQFHADHLHGRLPSDRVLVLPYQRLITDFATALREIAEFTGTPWSASLARVTAAVADEQRRRHSAHQYDLARFGLTPDRIRADYAPIYQRFL